MLVIWATLRMSAAQTQIISNSGFELGASSFWFRNGDSGILQGSYPHTPGTWYGHLGNVNNAIGSIHQFIDIPANVSSGTLSFYLNVVSYEKGSSTTCDKMDVNFRNAATDELLKKWTTYSESDKGNNVAGQYSQKTISFSSSDLLPYKGTRVLLQFYATTDYADSTIFRIDDVTFTVITDDTPAAPSFFETAGYRDHIDLGWADNSGNETGFQIERKINSGSFNLLTTTAANTTLYTDYDVSGCNTYTYRVRASNSIGSSTYSDESVNILRPAAPSNLTAIPNTNAISLAWTDNACNEAGLSVERKSGANGTWAQLGDNFPMNTVGITDMSSLVGTTYYYRVYAFNSSGNSAYSTEVSAECIRTYTINALAGTSGNITPSGLFNVYSGSNVVFFANPDSNFEVDSWVLDGAVTQIGGTNYTLSNVKTNHSLTVTFREETFSITVATELNGNTWTGPVQFKVLGPIALQCASVPFSTNNQPKGEYTLQYVSGGPANAYLSSIVQAPSNAAARKTEGVGSIILNFILKFLSRWSPESPVPTPDEFVIPCPSQPGTTYRLEYRDAITDDWHFLESKQATGTIVEFHDSERYSHQSRFYQHFPERSDADGVFRFPLRNFTPYTATIAAVFDHDVDHFGCSNGVVVAYTGERGSYKKSVWSATKESTSCTNDILFGFQNSLSNAFKINCHYTGGNGEDGQNAKTFLFYDGHTGYDFPAILGTEVLAAADGVVADADFAFDGLVLTHGNTGYKTYYLHLTNRLTTGTPVYAAKTVVGRVMKDHVHFTVTKDDIRVDPYGWEGQPGQDPLKVNGQDNKNLWIDFKKTGDCP